MDQISRIGGILLSRFYFFSHCDEGYILTRSLEFHVLSVSTHILITIKFHWPERNFFNFNIFNNCPSGIEFDNVIPCVNRWLAVSKSMGDGITHVPCAMKIEIPIKHDIWHSSLDEKYNHTQIKSDYYIIIIHLLLNILFVIIHILIS